MEIKKVEKLVATLYDKEEYVIHIRNLKQALDHALGLKINNCAEEKIGKLYKWLFKFLRLYNEIDDCVKNS